MKEKYKKENFEPIVAQSYSYSEVLRGLGMRDVGSNFHTIKKYIKLYNLDISHFTGQRWNKGLSHIEKTALIPLETILKEDTNYKSNDLKKRLIKAGLKQNKCECCGLEDSSLVLELHHINGNHYDNRLENLQILCPNCHSKTDNFRNRNAAQRDVPKTLYVHPDKKCICVNCGKEFISDRTDRTRKFCSRTCYNTFLTKESYTAKEQKIYQALHTGSSKNISKDKILEVIDNYKDLTNLGKHFSVSRTTMRKWLIEYELYEDFKFKYDFHSQPVAQYDMNFNLIKEWPSIVDAEKTLNIIDISKVINGHRRSAGGFLWKRL